MSCSGDGDDIGGIHVRRSTLVTVEDCAHPNEPRDTPVTTTIRSGEPSDQQQRSRSQSAPGFSSSSGLVREMLLSDTLSRRRAKTTGRDVGEELIDFFRETPPPPGNPMSAPDPVCETPGPSDEAAERSSRRFSLWPFRKKSKKRDSKTGGPPGLIRLPDSAVAGTTTDGHRHIAISIPIEHAHLDLVARNSATPRTKPPGERIIEEEAQDAPEAPEGQDRGGAEYVASGRDDMHPLPRQPSNGPAQQETAESPRPRCGNASVGAHNTILHPPRELTALPKGSTSAPIVVTNPGSKRRRPLHRQPALWRISADSDRLSDAQVRTATDQNLLRKRPSTPESFHTTSSELIFSDADTVHIPSPQSTAGFSASSDSDTDSYYTPEPAQSPLTIQDTLDGGDSSKDSSAPYIPSTSQASSIPESTLGHPAFSWQDFHRPHALSVTSVESLPSSALLDSPTFGIAQVVTLADFQPSSIQASPQHSGPSFFTSSLVNSTPQLPATQDHIKRHPRRVRAIADLRSALSPHGSLPPTHPAKDPITGLPAHRPHRPLTPNTTTISTTGITTNPYPSPVRRPLPPHSAGSSQPGPLPLPSSPPRPRQCSDPHAALPLRRHEDPEPIHDNTHDREIHTLLNRLERLEQSHERFLGALAPLLERLGSSHSHRLMPGDGGSGNRSRSRTPSPSGGSLRFGSLPRRDLDSSGIGIGFCGGIGIGGGVGGACSCGLGLGEGEGGLVGREREDRFGVDCDWDGRSWDGAQAVSGGLGGWDGDVSDGVGDGDGQVDINDESWLRSDSGSGDCSASASGDLVLDNGRWRLGLGENWRGAGDWRTTFAGRQAEAFMRDHWVQQGGGLDYLDDEEVRDHVEDPSGLGALETLMRDVVSGSWHGDDSIEGSTLFE